MRHFTPGSLASDITTTEQREVHKFEYRFVFVVVLYVSIDVDIGHLPSFDSGFNDQCSTADRVNPSTGKAASHVSGYCFHALVMCYIIPC